MIIWVVQSGHMNNLKTGYTFSSIAPFMSYPVFVKNY